MTTGYQAHRKQKPGSSSFPQLSLFEWPFGQGNLPSFCSCPMTSGILECTLVLGRHSQNVGSLCSCGLWGPFLEGALRCLPRSLARKAASACQGERRRGSAAGRNPSLGGPRSSGAWQPAQEEPIQAPKRPNGAQ